MQIKLIAIICVCLLINPAFAIPAEVDYVLDGDTFAAKVILDDGIKVNVRVRLDDIDTPEINGKCEYEKTLALRAKDRMQELLPVGTIVDLRNVDDDKYLGRIDAKVFLSDGRNVSDILLKEKLGHPYDGGRRSSWCE